LKKSALSSNDKNESDKMKAILINTHLDFSINKYFSLMASYSPFGQENNFSKGSSLQWEHRLTMVLKVNPVWVKTRES
jgi:hypothetical protein